MSNNLEMGNKDYRQDNPYHSIPNNDAHEYPIAKGVRPPDEDQFNERVEISMPQSVKLCLILTSICCFTLFFVVLLIK